MQFNPKRTQMLSRGHTLSPLRYEREWYRHLSLFSGASVQSHQFMMFFDAHACDLLVYNDLVSNLAFLKTVRRWARLAERWDYVDVKCGEWITMQPNLTQKVFLVAGKSPQIHVCDAH